MPVPEPAPARTALPAPPPPVEFVPPPPALEAVPTPAPVPVPFPMPGTPLISNPPPANFVAPGRALRGTGKTVKAPETSPGGIAAGACSGTGIALTTRMLCASVPDFTGGLGCASFGICAGTAEFELPHEVRLLDRLNEIVGMRRIRDYELGPFVHHALSSFCAGSCS